MFSLRLAGVLACRNAASAHRCTTLFAFNGPQSEGTWGLCNAIVLALWTAARGWGAGVVHFRCRPWECAPKPLVAALLPPLTYTQPCRSIEVSPCNMTNPLRRLWGCFVTQAYELWIQVLLRVRGASTGYSCSQMLSELGFLYCIRHMPGS